ncbi:ribosome maturation factor RimM [Oscillatoria amoena NRMC-F 0135]|nr:ribosome maturation factor RimM [Oscillatoria amoena NRMC-F 0135]
MDLKDYYKVGFIMKPHGLKGEVTVSLDADSPADWNTLKSVFVLIRGQLVPHFIEQISLKNNKAFVKFEDVNDAASAIKLQKSALYLLKSNRPALQRGDFYNDEVVEFMVTDEEQGVLGTVSRVEQVGPNRFLIVRYDQKEVMIPVIGPFILHISKSRKEIIVSLPKGFLEL